MKATLHTDDWIRLHVEEERFEGVHFDAKFTESDFSRCAFIGCTLDRVLMRKTKWRDVAFLRTKIVADITDARFEECRFEEVLFDGRKNEYGGVRVHFVRCDFTSSIFKGMNLRACRFLDCRFSLDQLHDCDTRGLRVENKEK